MARTPIASATRKVIRQRDQGRCKKCGNRRALEVHHIRAVVDGGTNEIDNLVLLCVNCHCEWHYICGAMPAIGWEKWLSLPPAAIVLTWLIAIDTPDLAELTLSEALNALHYSFAAHKEG